jgi:spoIIIJ-associated protein
MGEMGQAIEVTGADVETAIAAGLARLGVDQDAVEIEVLDEGSRGVFGLGARETRVRLTPKPEAEPRRDPVVSTEPVAPPVPEPADHAVEERDDVEVARGVLVELLELLDMDDAHVDVRQAEPAADEKEPPLVLNVHGPDADALIGRRGETLAALQHIARLIVGRELAGRVHLVVDVDGFKARREKSLRRLAQRVAQQAVKTDRTVVLEPMPPYERRIIHLALRDHPHVTTQSVGEGDRRKVTIIPQY